MIALVGLVIPAVIGSLSSLSRNFPPSIIQSEPSVPSVLQALCLQINVARAEQIPLQAKA